MTSESEKRVLDYRSHSCVRRRPNRVAKAVFWCCLYASGAVAMATWLGVPLNFLDDLRVLDLKLYVLDLSLLALATVAVLHVADHAWRLVAAVLFLLLFAIPLFFETANHVMQLLGIRKGGHWVLGAVIPIELAQLVVPIVGLGIAVRHRLWWGRENAHGID